MAGGTRGKRGKRGDARPKAASRKAAARAPRPALGNDPFTRGAAPRPPAPGAERLAPPAPLDAAPGLAPASARPATRPTLVPPPEATAAAAPGPADERPAVEAAARRLDDVERRVETALDGLEERLLSLAARSGVAGAAGEAREAVARLLPALAQRLSSIADLARLLEPPERLDRHGMDPRLVERTAPLVELLYATWWRTQVRGIERVPAHGPLVIVANRAGLVPWDALVLRHALRRDHPARRELRPLLDDRELDAPVIGGAAIRLGAVRAGPEAAERLLREGVAVGVFPEGSAGARKAWRDRYRIQHFGRGGFVKLALRTGAAIVPCAIIGSEETSPAISRTGWLAEQLGLPLMSSSPLLRLAPAAAVPLPARWTLHFGAPVELGPAGPEGAEDAGRVLALTERVRTTLQVMLEEELAARTSVFL